MDPGVPGVLMRMAALAPPYMAPQNTPPSPISAMSGGMEKVKGTNRATAVTVVMPGSIPPTMPTTSPMNITSRFMGSTALAAPRTIYSSMEGTASMGRLSGKKVDPEAAQSRSAGLATCSASSDRTRPWRGLPFRTLQTSCAILRRTSMRPRFLRFHSARSLQGWKGWS